ncbi:RNA polymerase sigma factor [Halomonas sp. 3H]|uniref:RNA polymerase sigma factor n=1 Tax=Halomonas sp. 3H TaxID=2952527 RepID=UPI0020B77E49|nr:RNA polymerase sigma factor [Halomonas sp. 3H]
MDMEQEVGRLYRQHSPRVLATLIRLTGDFDLAEEAMQEAFATAMQQWPGEGVPEHPVAWLVRVGQRRNIDQIRRHQVARRHARQQAPLEDEALPLGLDALDAVTIQDDMLRLLFTCCHPALAMADRVALTLREMCGLTTEQVAAALLARPATLAQRIVRAKRRLRELGLPYQVPQSSALPERLAGVLRVLYLVFNEGYSRSDGEALLDVSLAEEAIRTARALVELLPRGEAFGLLALMLLHDARRAARQGDDGELIPLEAQDRRRWDRERIDQGLACLARGLALTPIGPYTLQASIAAVHAEAPRAEATDWSRIVRLYAALQRCQPSPVVALNHAVAVAMRDTPEAGLRQLATLGNDAALADFHLFHAARADLLRRAGRRDEARPAYRRALALCSQGPERRYLERRLAELER